MRFSGILGLLRVCLWAAVSPHGKRRTRRARLDAAACAPRLQKCYGAFAARYLVAHT